MKTLRTLAALALAAALIGCGKAPATGVSAENVARAAKAPAAKATTKAPAAAATAKPAAGTQAPGVTTRPGGAATAKPAIKDGEGDVKLTIRLWGTAPVQSLVLSVVSQDDPTLTAEVPIALTGPEAVWEQAGLPAGRYTLKVAALGADGKAMGGGSTEGIVADGELADITLDVTVDAAASPSPTPTASPDTEVLGTEPTPTPSASATPAATPTPATGAGGTLGLHVEIF